MKAGAPDPDLRVAVGHASLLGESPMWHPGEQLLYYCDIPGHRLQRFDPRSGKLEHWDFDTDVSACAARADGSLLLSLRDGLWRFDPASAERTPLAVAPYDPQHQRFNDGKCDAQGRFWVSTICEPRLPAAGGLYCFDGQRLHRRLDGVSIGNGLGWSPDGRTMYFADTFVNTVFAFDFDPDGGPLSRRREFVRFVDDAGRDDYLGQPDGAAVDREGCCWLAMYDGQRLLRIAPSGEIVRQVLLPVRCPTMPAFGGDDLCTLYVTTARENRPADELAAQPLAGCVLALQVDVPGLPVHFAL